MNQYVLANFDLTINEKYFKFCFVPAVTNFDDIFAALDAFKAEVEKLQAAQKAEEEKLRLEKEAAESADAEAIEPEIVS